MERIRRNVQITYENQTPEENARAGYVSERPWDWVWGAALGDTGHTFWESEVHRPALFFLARIKSRNESTLDGITVLSGLATSGVDAGETDLPKRPRPKKKSKKERNLKTKLKKGTETTKVEWDKTSEVCNNFLKGTCSDPCPYGRIHQAGASPGGKGKGPLEEGVSALMGS